MRRFCPPRYDHRITWCLVAMACAVSVVWGIAGYFVLQDYEVPLTCTEEVRPHYASQAEFTQALEEYENRWCSLR